ncbi:hypothetical protein KIW84_013932 [Lathyrus oleraceus]|uniref:Uncharacterized protein n=1 Tax=Pisum sativum TaxID=3888 RepID=A0A9D5GYG0_PEA|nr:hypothetical protein KIW84_013932 [Pisum sativum]
MEEGAGNCLVCRKPFHAKDLDHVLDLVGSHSSRECLNSEVDNEENILQSEDEIIRKQRFKAILSLQKENNGLIEPKKDIVILPDVESIESKPSHAQVTEELDESQPTNAHVVEEHTESQPTNSPVLEEPAETQHKTTPKVTDRVSSWLQKESWTQLVNNDNNSFRISQILPDITFPEQTVRSEDVISGLSL